MFAEVFQRANVVGRPTKGYTSAEELMGSCGGSIGVTKAVWAETGYGGFYSDPPSCSRGPSSAGCFLQFVNDPSSIRNKTFADACSSKWNILLSKERSPTKSWLKSPT